MGDTFDLIAFNRWFCGNVTYHGDGIARFASPIAIARGPTTIRFDLQGEPSIEMEVESFETEYEARFGPMEVFYPEGRQGNAFTLSFKNSNQCESLEVDTGDGVFTAHGKISYSRQIEGEELTKLSFSTFSGDFVRRDVRPAVYWAVPLVNFTFPFVQRHPELYSHPLRMWKPAPTPPELPPEDTAVRLVESAPLVIHCG